MKQYIPKIIIGILIAGRIIFHFGTNLYQASGGEGTIIYFVWSILPYFVLLILAFIFRASIKCVLAGILILFSDILNFVGVSGEEIFFIAIMPFFDLLILIPIGLGIGFIVENFTVKKVLHRSNKNINES